MLISDGWTREMCIAHLQLHGAQFVLAGIGRRGNFYAVIFPDRQLMFRDSVSKDRTTIASIYSFRGKYRGISDKMHWYTDAELRGYCDRLEVQRAVK